MNAPSPDQQASFECAERQSQVKRCKPWCPATRCCGTTKTPPYECGRPDGPPSAAAGGSASPETYAQAVALKTRHAMTSSWRAARQLVCRPYRSWRVTLSLAVQQDFEDGPNRPHGGGAGRRNPAAFRRQPRSTACITRPTRPARTPARSAATWPK
jgi:hypothetical protein